jgi:hypothetical protein
MKKVAWMAHYILKNTAVWGRTRAGVQGIDGGAQRSVGIGWVAAGNSPIFSAIMLG